LAVELIDAGIAPGHPGLDKVAASVRTEATILIARLSLWALAGSAGTIATFSDCRIDRQPPPAGGSNLQVQLNGLWGESSIATCAVVGTVLLSRAPWPDGLRKHQEGWLLRQVRIALTRSLTDGHIYRIVGSFTDNDNATNLTPRECDHYRALRPGSPPPQVKYRLGPRRQRQ